MSTAFASSPPLISFTLEISATLSKICQGKAWPLFFLPGQNKDFNTNNITRNGASWVTVNLHLHQVSLSLLETLNSKEGLATVMSRWHNLHSLFCVYLLSPRCRLRHPLHWVFMFPLPARPPRRTKGLKGEDTGETINTKLPQRDWIAERLSREAMKSDHTGSNLASGTMKWITFSILLRSTWASDSPHVNWR